MIERERAVGRQVNNARERDGECQVDIVDGDNAAEIAGGQRGLMMMLLLLASERASGSEQSELLVDRDTTPLHPLPPICPPSPPPSPPPVDLQLLLATSRFLYSATPPPPSPPLALSVILEPFRYRTAGVVPLPLCCGVFPRELVAIAH